MHCSCFCSATQRKRKWRTTHSYSNKNETERARERRLLLAGQIRRQLQLQLKLVHQLSVPACARAVGRFKYLLSIVRTLQWAEFLQPSPYYSRSLSVFLQQCQRSTRRMSNVINSCRNQNHSSSPKLKAERDILSHVQ